MEWIESGEECEHCNQWTEDIFTHWKTCESYITWQEESTAKAKEMLGEDTYNALMEAASNFNPPLA